MSVPDCRHTDLEIIQFSCLANSHCAEKKKKSYEYEQRRDNSDNVLYKEKSYAQGLILLVV